MGRAAAWTIGAGALLMAASFGQAAVPARVFETPQDLAYGLAVVPVWILGVSCALFAVGAIIAAEGICDAFGGASIAGAVAASPALLPRLLACGAAAGLVLEIIAQWMGRFWYYPWWTPWFYSLMLVPGFMLYWLFIVETYLAAKAVLDAAVRTRPGHRSVRLWPVGAVALAICLTAWISWYAERGFSFNVTGPTPDAPPPGYAVLAVAGVALLSTALVTAAARRYWVPFAAVVLASVPVSVAFEIPNAAHWQWAYAHFPGPQVPDGLPLAVFLAWPLQYVVFLAVPSVIMPRLATLFWYPPATA